MFEGTIAKPFEEVRDFEGVHEGSGQTSENVNFSHFRGSAQKLGNSMVQKQFRERG